MRIGTGSNREEGGRETGRIGSNRAKKGHLLLKSTLFSKLAGCQWVNLV